MPELPEVETTRRDLEDRVRGRAITDVWIADGSPQPQGSLAPDELRAAVAGRRIERLDRRGKYLIMALSGGLSLILHRRMTGNLVLWTSPPAPPLAGEGSTGERCAPSLQETPTPRRVGEGSMLARDTGQTARCAYPPPLRGPSAGIPRGGESEGTPRTLKGGRGVRFLRAILFLDDGRELHWLDQRKFGTWTLTDDPAGALKGMGPEPLDESWTPADLVAALRERRAPIKAVLLDQRRVAGLGNIYADESLHAAGIHPSRPAGSLSVDEIERLHAAVRAVLEKAIRLQGSSARDYVGGLGQRGSMQDEWRVYGRAGHPCAGCGAPVEKLRVGGRGTHICPNCQPVRGSRAPRNGDETPVPTSNTQHPTPSPR